MDCHRHRLHLNASHPGASRRRTLVLVVLALAGVVLGAAGGRTQPSSKTAPVSAPPLVFDWITVVDVEHGRLLQNQRVVIVGTRIRSMGAVSAVQIPAGAQVVDAHGKYLIPGLWDMHTHSMRSIDVFYPLFLANGVTGIRDAGSAVPLDTLVLWRREILAGTRVGPPRQLLSGPGIDASEKWCLGVAYHICVATPAAARRAVDSLKAAGANIIKTYNLSRDMYFAIAAEARRVGIPFGGHVFRATGITPLEASDSGAGILDHINAAARLNALCVGDTASVRQCGRAAERFRHNGTWWDPTLVTIEDAQADPNFQNPILNRSHRTPAGDTVFMRWYEFVRRFSAGADSRLDLRHGPLGSADQAARALHRDSPTDSGRGGVLALVHRVGLPLLTGTDVAEGSLPGFALHTELALYVAEGLTPLEALQAATLNPAKFLHGTDSLGTVAPGKLADLVVLDADPLQDITNTTLIRAVVANGRYFDRAALDQLVTMAQAGMYKKQ